MTVPSLIVWGCIAMGAVAIWATIFYAIPSIQKSIFRYRMWELRDAVVDDLFAGRLPDHPAVLHFISRCEHLILKADDISVAQHFVMPRPPQQRLQQHEEEKAAFRAELKLKARNRLLAYDHEGARIFVDYFGKGGPSGWLFSAFCHMRRFLKSLFARAADSRTSPPTATPSNEETGTLQGSGKWETQVVVTLDEFRLLRDCDEDISPDPRIDRKLAGCT